MGCINDFIYLSYGKIRYIEEEQQLIDSFKLMRNKNEKLVVIGTKLFSKKPSLYKKPLKRIVFEVQLFKHKRRGVLFYNKRLSDIEQNYWLSAADVMISPRIRSLNSGIVLLAFSYGKPIIGPDVGNIGNILKFNNNPTFIPNDISSISDVLRKVKNQQFIEKVVFKNFNYLNTNCNSEHISSSHYSLYKTILNE